LVKFAKAGCKPSQGVSFASSIFLDFCQNSLGNAGIAEILISKQRNGPTGSIKLAFLKEFTRFENYFGE
jgi:replicative DNA helicase